MTIDDAIAELSERIKSASPEAVIRITRVSAEEASIRAYASAEAEKAIKHATLERSIELLTSEGLDVQVFVYDIATSLPPEE
jgi:predicted component of type VI protein secretion system